MKALYVTSAGSTGKTALCLGIGKKLMQERKKVGFFRPIRFSDPGLVDGYKDTLFIKEALSLGEPLEILSPIVLSRRDLWQSLTTDTENFKKRLEQAYNRISPDKEVVIMEGLSDLATDRVAEETCYQVTEALDSGAVIVLRYSRALALSKVAEAGQRLGRKLLGVVVNFAPRSKIEQIKDDLETSFQKEGVRVLGVLPEERALLGVSVAELAEALSGEIVTHPEAKGEIIENIMIGALSPDPATYYFSHKANKAAVIRGERADMQLAALQTSTKCLVLTGNIPPASIIINEAENKRVPIIVVKQNVASTVTGIEEALKQAKFHSLKKLEKFSQILEDYFDFQALYQALGLKG